MRKAVIDKHPVWLQHAGTRALIDHERFTQAWRATPGTSPFSRATLRWLERYARCRTVSLLQREVPKPSERYSFGANKNRKGGGASSRYAEAQRYPRRTTMKERYRYEYGRRSFETRHRLHRYGAHGQS